MIAKALPVIRLVIVAVALVSLAAPGPAAGAEPPAAATPVASKPITLTVGQGLRLADGAVVPNAGKPGDVQFQMIEPRPGGLRPQYNAFTRQMGWRPEMPIDRNMPLLAATRARDFTDPPDVDAITTGDLAAGHDSIYLSAAARHWLVQDGAGEAYLLRGRAAGTESTDPKAWRFEFTYEKVTLPLGPAGGKRNPPLPGRLLYRNRALNEKAVWCDLATGAVTVAADGRSPTATADGRSLAVARGEGDWLVQDPARKVTATLRTDPPLVDAALSPDGKLLAGTSKVPTLQKFLDMTIPGPDATVLRVLALDNTEVARFANATDAAWTPDGRLIAAPPEGPGLLKCDVATGNTEPLADVPTDAGNPAVSPDGKTLAYVSHARVYLTDLAPGGAAGGDGKPRGAWDDARRQRWPAFSPDGRYLALVSENVVRVVDLRDGTVITPIARAGWDLGTDNGCRLTWAR